MMPYLFLFPQLLLLGAFSIYPFFYNLYLSFHEIGITEIFTGSGSFDGFGQYAKLMRDQLFWISLKNTFFYTVGSLPLTVIGSLLCAIALNSQIVGKKLWRVIYLFPYLTSWVVVGLLWQWMYSNNYGIFNKILNHFGLPGLGWLQDSVLVIPSIIITSTWHNLGYYMVIFMAGLLSIPNEYYEASMIDGANQWQRFRLITLPLLEPIMFMVLVLATINSFKIFDQIYVMTGGGPGSASLMIVNLIFSSAINEMKSSYAAAMSIALFLIIVVLVIAQRRMFRSSDGV